MLLLLGAALAAGALRWNLAHTGLWSDEAWTVKHTMTGYAEPARDGSGRLEVRRPSWADTLWLYYQPTNQVLYSVLGRLSLGAWQRASGHEPPAFDELIVRLPAFLGAMAAVVALGLLLAEWGLPRAGAAAAWLLAIHPWYIRFGADGRSYSLVVLFAVLAALLLVRALRRGAWSAWWRYGAVIFLMVWGHLFSVYLAATLGLAGLAAIAGGPGARRTRRVRAARLAVVNLAAGMLVLQLMAPNLAQLGRWRGIFIGDVQSAHLTLPAVGHLWTLASVGVEAREPDVPERRPGAYASLADWSAARAWTWPVVLGLMPLLVAAGLLRLLARGGPERWAALGLAAGIPVALLVNWLNQDQWYSRFGAYALPATAGFAAVGLDGLLAALPWPGGRVRRLGPAAGLALGLAAFQLFVRPQTQQLLSRPHTPSQEVAALFARASGGDPEAAIRAVFGNVAGEIVVATYDPWIRVPTTVEDVAGLCAEARASGKPLLLAYGHPARNRRNHPELFRLLDDPQWFRELATFDAIEVEHLMRVLRYTGRPLPVHFQALTTRGD